MPLLSHYIRNWDVVSSSRVHEFAANSRNVARRLNTYYGRDAKIIYPPVDVESFTPVPVSEVEDYYLMVGELVPYKRAELAVQAFNQLGKRLVVIGGGQMLSQLKSIAGDNVEILGPQPFEILRHHYAHCRALIFPGEEDFGIVPVEAMASGRPVIAFRRGGALETVVEGVSGAFFEEQSVDAIIDACSNFEKQSFDPDVLVEHAKMFGSDRFHENMSGFVQDCLARHIA